TTVTEHGGGPVDCRNDLFDVTVKALKEIAAIERARHGGIQVAVSPREHGLKVGTNRCVVGAVLEVACLDLVQAGQHLDVQPAVERKRLRGQRSAQQVRSEDRIDRVTTQCLGDLTCLQVAQLGQPGPSVGGVD